VEKARADAKKKKKQYIYIYIVSMIYLLSTTNCSLDTMNIVWSGCVFSVLSADLRLYSY
jgi:hypothetical protein